MECAQPTVYRCTPLPEQFGRAAVRCQCGLVQFLGERLQCRRCRIDFTIAPPMPPAPVLSAVAAGGDPARQITRAIRFCREASGLTQIEVAKRAGSPRSHISKLERGLQQPNAKTAVKLAAAMGIPMWLFCALCEVRGL